MYCIQATPLYMAAMSGHLKVAETLLAAKANVNAPNEVESLLPLQSILRIKQ